MSGIYYIRPAKLSCFFLTIKGHKQVRGGALTAATVRRMWRAGKLRRVDDDRYEVITGDAT